MNCKGLITPLVVAILTFISISTIAFVYFLDTQTRITVKEQKSISAYNIAYSGLEQTINKLNSTFRGWEDILRGNIPQGYRGERIFNYTHKGKNLGFYKVKISSAPDDVVIIESAGTDLLRKEVVKLKAVYRAGGYEAPIISFGKVRMKIKGDAEVHWGPIISVNSDIELTGGTQWFPRKYAGKGYRVIPRDDDALAPPHYGFSSGYTGPPNDPKYAEWTSNASIDVDPDIDILEYKEKAKKYRPPFFLEKKKDNEYEGYMIIGGKKEKVVTFINLIPWIDPVNKSTGAYFYRAGSGDAKFKFENKFRDYRSTATYYIEGDVEIANDVFIGPADGTIPNNEVALIVMGNFKANGKGGIRLYTIRVPEKAADEYKNGTVVNETKGDTAAINEYPADDGLGKTRETFTFNKDVKIGNEKYEEIYFNGFLYVNGERFEVKGDETFAGAIYLAKGVIEKTQVGGKVRIFYSDSVEKNIRYVQRTFRRKEITTASARSWHSPW